LHVSTAATIDTMRHLDYLRHWGPQPEFDAVFNVPPPSNRLPEKVTGSDRRFPKSEPAAYVGVQPGYREFLDAIDGKTCRVLDVGCGAGTYRQEINRRGRYVGMDANAALHPEVVCDFNRQAFPFPAESFDVVLSDSVLEHVMQPFAVMDEIHRVLKKGGRGFILVPFHYKAHGSPHDFFRYSKGGLHFLLRKFTAIEIYPIGGSMSVLCHILWNYGRALDRLHVGVGNAYRSVVWCAFTMLNRLDRFDPYKIFTRGHYAFFRK
jgi:SAM-dependent methyltransferase